MSSYFEMIAVSSPGKVLEEVSNQEGVRTASITMTRSITPAKDLQAVWQLYRLFKKENPSIVHTHTPKAGLLGMIAARMAGVPVRMHTVAGMPLMETKGFKKKILQGTERLTYSCATAVYPNSKNLALLIQENNFCKKGKLKVLGNGSSNGIDTEFFQSNEPLETSATNLRQSLNIGGNDFVFLFVGRLVKDKGIEELVTAFVNLKSSYPFIKLLLVGPYEEDLDPLSDGTKTIIHGDQNIIHAGFQKDIRPYLIISSVLAFPSYREGFPNVPMQAGCFHLPSIVTNINGCNEIIEHGMNGLIIPPKNAEALQDAMLALLTDERLYDKLKSNARRMIVERYEQKMLWSLLLNEYNEQIKLSEVVS
jgi:glycosyltransferase involved in cell wall biosynthesis